MPGRLGRIPLRPIGEHRMFVAFRLVDAVGRAAPMARSLRPFLLRDVLAEQYRKIKLAKASFRQQSILLPVFLADRRFDGWSVRLDRLLIREIGLGMKNLLRALRRARENLIEGRAPEPVINCILESQSFVIR